MKQHATARSRRRRVCIDRGRLLVNALDAIRLLRAGRWTVDELADELNLSRETVYRIFRALRRAGIVLQRSPEYGPGHPGCYYRVTAAALKRTFQLAAVLFSAAVAGAAREPRFEVSGVLSAGEGALRAAGEGSGSASPTCCANGTRTRAASVA